MEQSEVESDLEKVAKEISLERECRKIRIRNNAAIAGLTIGAVGLLYGTCRISQYLFK